MDISKDSRRSNVAGLAASNVFLRRRKTSTPLKDSPEEDRGGKKEGDGGTLKRKRHRRVADKVVQGAVREEGDDNTEEIISDEDEHRVEASGGVSRCRMVFDNHHHYHNKGLPPPRVAARQITTLKFADEMIGVSVPRKARSASVKRPHESWVSGNVGFGEDQNHRRILTWSAGSNFASRKKAKSSESKPRLSKMRRTFSPVQEDIELEIAEVLYGLSKQSQSQSSQNEEGNENASEKLAAKDTTGAIRDSKSSPTSNSSLASVLTQFNSIGFDPFPASKNKKLDVESAQAFSGSIISVIKDEIVQPAETGASKPVSGTHNWQGDSKPGVDTYEVAAKYKSNFSKVEYATCTDLDADFLDSISTKVTANVSELDSQQERTLKIDLMAPPPMVLPPEKNDFVDLSLNPKPSSRGIEVKMRNMVAELKVDLEKPKLEGGNDHDILENSKHESNNDHGLKQKWQQAAKFPKLETSAQSGSAPFPISTTSWQNGRQPVGYKPLFQTVLPVDRTIRSSTALQVSHFLLSQPRPKRCATHHYVACNIRHHQKCMKMNDFWPTAAGSAALCGDKANNLDDLLSTDTMVIGKPLQRSLPAVNLISAQVTGQAVANYPALAGKDKSSDSADTISKVQNKHGPTIFSVGQHQTTLAATGNQGGPATPAATRSFNYPKFSPNESLYMTLLPNNSCPCPVFAPIANPATFTTAKPAGSFYPSQVLCPSHVEHPQPRPWPLVQPVHQNASTSSRSSSHKQSQSQQSRRAQADGKNFITPTGMQSQQHMKQHWPSYESQKLEIDVDGERAQRVTNMQASDSKNSSHGQSFIVPLQPNFVSMPSTIFGGTVNYGEKRQQQQSHEKTLKSEVELIHSPAYAMPFASSYGNKSASNLNFSPLGQNPLILQSISDMTWQGHQVLSAAQATQKKNHQLSEGKTGCHSANTDGREVLLGSSSTAHALVFDNSSQTLGFGSSPLSGNWSSLSVNSITNVSVAANSPNSQKQQLSQFQKQQQAQHPIGTTEIKASTSNLSSPCMETKLSSNPYDFSQTLSQSNTSTLNRHWKNSPRSLIPKAPATSIMASNTTTFYSVSQLQEKAPQGSSQILFGGYLKSRFPPHGQQLTPSNQSQSVLVVGAQPSGGNLSMTSMGTKANLSVLALQSQHNDNCGNAQKSSPVCGRNVPSILSTYPGHLSELKY